MSKVKSPKEKKELSLKKDRRNVYGENPSASRKGIRRGKQRSHMEERRAVNEELRAVTGPALVTDADEAEGRVRDRVAILKNYAFKKCPDAPLSVVLERKGRRPTDKTKKRK